VDTWRLGELIVFVLGTLLTGFLCATLAGKRPAVPRLIVLLFGLLLFWYAGNLIDLLVEPALGGRLHALGLLLDAMKGIGYWLMAPLLVHTLLDFLARMEERPASRVVEAFVYLPSLVLARSAWRLMADPAVSSLAGFGGEARLYVYLQVAYLAVAAGCGAVIARRVRLEEARGFFRLLPWPLLAVAICLVAGERLGALDRRETAGPGQVVLFACPLLPALYFLWAIFRWNLLELSVRNSTLRTLLLVLVVLLYFGGVRRLGEWMQARYGVSSEPLEVVLFLGLVLAIEPLRRVARRLFHSTWFRDREWSLEILERFGRELVSVEGDAARLERLLLARFPEAFETETARLLKPGDPDPAAQAVLAAFEAGGRAPVNILRGAPADVVSAIRALGGRVLLPVGDGDEFAGVLLLGPRKFNRHYGSGEIEEARLALLQYCAALRNRRLVAERILADRKAQQAERLSALGMLSASVAHEVKNPLSSIRAIGQSMEEELPPGHPLRKDLEVIEREVERLDRVVHEVLAFARPGAADRGPLDVVPIVRNVIYIVTHEARRRGVTIEEASSGVRVLALAGEAGLKAALFNVVLNAVAASPEGRPVRVAVTGGDVVSIRVTNEGPGIPPEVREHLFEPFASRGGTGLGLALAKERIESFGGRISVESVPGATTFAVELEPAR